MAHLEVLKGAPAPASRAGNQSKIGRVRSIAKHALQTINLTHAPATLVHTQNVRYASRGRHSVHINLFAHPNPRVTEGVFEANSDSVIVLINTQGDLIL